MGSSAVRVRGKEISEVSENSSSRAARNPMELWRQWLETSARAWSDMFGGATRESYLDPYRPYRQWFSGLKDAGEQTTQPAQTPPFALMNPTAAMLSPGASQAGTPTPEAQNLWKEWFEAVSDSWQETAELGKEAVELTPRWGEMLGQIWYNFLSAEGFPTDPLQFITRWYNATDGPLSEFMGDLIQREEILQLSSRFLRSYASFYSVFRRDSEKYLKALQIPVRSDVTRVAGLVVAIEDKLDRLEEAFEEFEYGYAKPATAESMEAIEERIERLEQTIGHIEGSATDTATADSVSGLESRIDGVEAKIDQILAALQNISENGSVQEMQALQVEASSQEAEASPEAESAQVQAAPQATVAQQTNGEMVRATAAARRKAEELGVDLSAIEGTGANGQVTVDDVRREGAS
jgi:predicted  nucleic acid-binding Zn-ribbon protein